MCTAATYYAKDHYFGRNLDLEFSYHEEITIVPRNYPFIFRKCEGINHHYAMIGTAFVVEGYPLFYDAVNEKGLGIAGPCLWRTLRNSMWHIPLQSYQ